MSARSLSLGALLVALGGCGVQVEGDFDGVPFAPTSSVFGVADRHDLVASGGSFIAVRRSDDAMRMSLVLSAAEAPFDEEWRRFPADRLLSLKKDLATLDGVVLTGIPLARALALEDLEVHLDGSGRAGSGDFEVALVPALPPDEGEDTVQGFGADVNVKLIFEYVEVTPHGGSLAAELEVKRARAESQLEGDVATGEVTVRFQAPLAPERLGKSNLSILLPVMQCAAREGPVGAGACRDEAPLPYVDASGTLTGP